MIGSISSQLSQRIVAAARRIAPGRRGRTLLAASLMAAGGSACDDEALPGDLYEVDLTGVSNTCTAGGANYQETLEYRLELEDQDVRLSIGEDLWAQGTADGCLVTYSSIVWEDEVESYLVRWQIFGSARVNPAGGSGCVEDGDWVGDEQFVVLSTDHPDIQAGCTYDITTTGRSVGSGGGDE